MSNANDTIGKMIKAAGKTKSKLAGDYTPPCTDDTIKTAADGGLDETGMKEQGIKPMESFSADSVINAVNSAKTLDEKIKAYTRSSGYTTIDHKTNDSK